MGEVSIGFFVSQAASKPFHVPQMISRSLRRKAKGTGEGDDEEIRLGLENEDYPTLFD